MALLGAAQVLTEWQRVKHFPRGESLTARPEALHAQLAILAVCATMGIIAAYSLLIHFFRIEGRRYYHVHAKMALASEIHRSLVPVCQATVGGFEIYGASVASGEVGGDLVDFVEQPSGWTGYVADVSGHGVQSGVLMAMFKTAMRSHVLVGNSPSKLLNEVQQTIFPLKLSSMFVTAGVLQSDNAGRILFASAGHPPILHYQETGNAVSELSALDPPIGIFAHQSFSESAILCHAGDVLVVLTDGLTEVFNKREAELGLPAIKATLLKHAGSPLEQLFDELRAIATNFGPQSDDQTMLLVRYLG